jgi:hypothetical protein
MWNVKDVYYQTTIAKNDVDVKLKFPIHRLKLNFQKYSNDLKEQTGKKSSNKNAANKK